MKKCKSKPVLAFHQALRKKLPKITKKQIAIVKYCATFRTAEEIMRHFNFSFTRTRHELNELIYAKIIVFIRESNRLSDSDDSDDTIISANFHVADDIIRPKKLSYPVYSGTMPKKARMILREKIEKYCRKSKTAEQIAKKFQISLYSVANFTKPSPILVGISVLNLKEKKYETKYINISPKENKYKLY